jgi:flagellar biosynthetic protein FliQ
MSAQDAIQLGREAIVTSLLLGAPILVVGILVGLVMGLVQALTQIQDQTLSFVPKIIAMIVATSVFLPWLVELMIQYAEAIITNIPGMLGAG